MSVSVVSARESERVTVRVDVVSVRRDRGHKSVSE